MIPIFSTHYSGTVLTLDDPDELLNYQKKKGYEQKLITGTDSVSVFSIARLHDLNEVFVADSSMSGFIKGHTVAQKEKKLFRFGLKLWVCQNLSDKSDESCQTESKVIVWVLNSDGLSDLIKINNASCRPENFYYHNRVDWPTLKRLLTPNLAVSVDYHDGFLSANNIQYRHCAPDLSIDFTYLIGNTGLPYEPIIQKKIREFAPKDKLIEFHPVYYYSNDYFKGYLTMRCSKNRSTMEKPDLSHFCSNQFSWEAYCGTIH